MPGLFRQTGTLDGWTSRLQPSMEANGIQLTLLQALPSAKIYLWRGPDGTLALNAFAVDHGQPLFVALIGSVPAVSLGGPDQLRADGTLAAFTTIVTSIRAVPADPANVSPPLDAATTIVTPDSGPWYGDSGVRYWDGFSYRLQDTYEQAPPKVRELWEWMYYPNYHNFRGTIYRTNVTDTPDTACIYGGCLVEHPINKFTTPTSGYITDDFWPERYVAHLNPTTAHMEVFGVEAASVYCKWYKPYTH